MSAPWHSTDVVLERGGPWEIMPEQRPKMQAAAQRYLREDHPAEAKERVAAVWIAGEPRPAWQLHQKLPDLRAQMPAYNQPEPETDFG